MKSVSNYTYLSQHYKDVLHLLSKSSESGSSYLGKNPQLLESLKKKIATPHPNPPE